MDKLVKFDMKTVFIATFDKHQTKILDMTVVLLFLMLIHLCVCVWRVVGCGTLCCDGGDGGLQRQI